MRTMETEWSTQFAVIVEFSSGFDSIAKAVRSDTKSKVLNEREEGSYSIEIVRIAIKKKLQRSRKIQYEYHELAIRL